MRRVFILAKIKEIIMKTHSNFFKDEKLFLIILSLLIILFIIFLTKDAQKYNMLRQYCKFKNAKYEYVGNKHFCEFNNVLEEIVWVK
jgi:hypothetical protein